MTIQQCKYVLAIARNGSMNEAAKHLLVSQASLSSAVHEIETEFGIRIFDRSNKGVRITKDGAEFIRYLRQLLSQYDIINERYLSEDKKSVRNFSVSSQHYDFVAASFAAFAKKFRSDYSFSLKEVRTSEVIEDVKNLNADIGILAYLNSPSGGYMERYLRRNDIDIHPLLETGPYVFLGKEHPLAESGELTLEELRDFPYVTYDQGSVGPTDFSEELAENNLSRKRIRISDRATLMNLLMGTDCYTIGTGIMPSDLNNGNVVSVRLKSEDIYTVAVINRVDVGLSEDAERFVKLMIDSIKGSGATVFQD